MTYERRSLLVTAHLATPLCGDAPMLDAVLENEMAQREGKADRLRRDLPLPADAEAIHIPILIAECGPWSVPCCSSPIYGPSHSDRVEHVCKRLATEYADQLAPRERLVVATGNATYKSYRLPMRLRHVERVAWICQGDRRPILQLLRSVWSIGKKRSVGYGRLKTRMVVGDDGVERPKPLWTAEYIDGHHHWYAPSEAGTVLMRPLPFGDWLPDDLIGFRRDFGGVKPPYWHPDRYTEIVVPC